MLWRHTYHVSADCLCHHAPHRGFGTPSSREGRGWGWHQGRAHCSLGEEWRRQGSRAHSHRNRYWGRRRGFRSAQRRSGLSLRGRHHLADDAVKKKRATVKTQQISQVLQNPCLEGEEVYKTFIYVVRQSEDSVLGDGFLRPHEF